MLEIKKVAEELTKWQVTIILLTIHNIVMFVAWFALFWMLLM